MIKRAPRPNNGFSIFRNEVLRDGRLSYRARGILFAILSRPDNWTASAEQLAAEAPGGEGVKAVRTALRELEKVGYLERHRSQGTDGRFTWDQMVYDLPKERPAIPIPGQRVSAGQTMGQVSTDGEPPDGNRPSQEEQRRKNDKEDETKCPTPFGRGGASENQDSFADSWSDAAAETGTVTKFEDWRSEDRALFRALVGAHLASDGTRWREGVYPADAWYDALRKMKPKPLKWPGKFFQALEETRGVEDWLAGKGVEVAA